VFTDISLFLLILSANIVDDGVDLHLKDADRLRYREIELLPITLHKRIKIVSESPGLLAIGHGSISPSMPTASLMAKISKAAASPNFMRWAPAV
jgi:hypothetical protein